MESVLPSKYMICDNKWHNVTALFNNEKLVLGIDNYSFQATFTALGNTQARSSFYIGGIPGNLPLENITRL